MKIIKLIQDVWVVVDSAADILREIDGSVKLFRQKDKAQKLCDFAHKEWTDKFTVQKVNINFEVVEWAI